ncbi:hypothetical protein BC351_00335 [Paenibacillus ferrarius]|uniref:Uncharacterized protein n=1 Tax=Paenibacillus ferrarius TaxID=1469647 RepID=A0A1V4HS08_9BACL|nr:hypothetical protein [Paenibacillus ferrarius]OPH61724.1 hypothetical protein BC351_00335 [Paenibacillus ferrarius]
MSAYVTLNKMAGNQLDTCVISVQNTVDMDNGSLVVLGGVLAGNPDIRVVAAPVDVTKDEVVLVQSPEIIEVNGLRVPLTDVTLFTNAKNRPARAYRLKVGDTFTITDDGIAGTTVLNKYVVPVNASMKPAVAADLTGLTRIAFQVIQKLTVSVGSARVAATQLEVVKQA